MSADVIVGLLLAVAAFVALAYHRHWQWTGLPAAKPAGDSHPQRPAKTLWDWLQLLGIPVALAALAFLLNDAQSRREEQRAVDVERESTLRAYLAQMADLMLDRHLSDIKRSTPARDVARSATLTAVRRLDGERKALVIQFLAEAGLLDPDQGDREFEVPPVILASADLAGVELREASLAHVDLSETDLAGADLHAVGFTAYSRNGVRASRLSGADLSHADLSLADLRGADLHGATLRGASLVSTDLVEAELTETDSRDADFNEATLRRANLAGANLRSANLTDADLRGADLSDADLRQANLSGANLRRADLSGADIRGARGLDLSDARGTPGRRDADDAFEP